MNSEQHIESTIQEIINQIEGLQQDLGEYEQLMDDIGNSILNGRVGGAIPADVSQQLAEINAKLNMIEDMDEQLASIKNTIDEKLNLDFVAMYNNLLEQMNVEAIKIYRNVQAVIVEEDSKQNHVLFGVDDKSSKLKRRINHMMIVSIVSFVVSILVMIIQILPALGVKF